MASGDSPRVGDRAPEFSLPTASGAMLSLADFRGKKAVVLFFYPKDNSPACTLEACSFRDSHEVLAKAGAEVIGVSANSARSHEQFAGRLHLPFPLLSDADGALRKLYGVPRTLGLFPGRVTYLIDKLGIIRHIHSSQFLPMGHAGQMLAALKAIQAEESFVPADTRD